MKRILLLAAFLILAGQAHATTRYIAQSAGTFSGGNHCNGQTAITPATWNSTSESAGDISYICGTVTGSAGCTALTFGWSGGSGNRLQLIWDDNAVLQCPYFDNTNGAISLNGKSHILINGGLNGILRTSANGTSLANQQGGKGIYSGFSGSDIEIEQLNIPVVYQIVGQDVANETAWTSTSAIQFDEGYDNYKIHNNNIAFSRVGFYDQYTTLTSAQVYNNTIDYGSWEIVMGDAVSSSTAAGVLVYGNQVGPHFQAFTPADQAVHFDGIFLFADQASSSMTAMVYNNYVHGDGCQSYGNCTAMLFLGGGLTNSYIFNNILSEDVNQTGGPGLEAVYVIRGGTTGANPTNVYSYNNVFSGYSASVKNDAGGGNAGSGIVFSNNIFGALAGILSGPSNFNQITTSNFDDWYGLNYVAAYGFDGGSSAFFNTLANFQATTIGGSVHPEAAGSSGNPLLSSTFHLTTGSAAIGLGTNLHSTCNAQPNPGLGALCNDAAGNVRPVSAAWDAGVYNFQNVPAPYSGFQMVGSNRLPSGIGVQAIREVGGSKPASGIDVCYMLQRGYRSDRCLVFPVKGPHCGDYGSWTSCTDPVDVGVVGEPETQSPQTPYASSNIIGALIDDHHIRGEVLPFGKEVLTGGQTIAARMQDPLISYSEIQVRGVQIMSSDIGKARAFAGE